MDKNRKIYFSRGGIGMVKIFDGKKLVEAIIITEERIGELYRNLAEQVEDDKSVDLFNKLAEDEEKHKEIYIELLEKLPNNGEVEMSTEDIEYTETLIETNILTNKEIKKIYSNFDALLVAEKVERDGIILIHQLMDFYPSVAMEELKVILSEEKKHLKSILHKICFK